MAFDFDELAREDARGRLGEWAGAPLHFTTDYYTPPELDAAYERWCFLNNSFDAIRRSHMWHRFSWGAEEEVGFETHRIAMFSADLGPERGSEGPGGVPHLAVCEPCQWYAIGSSENEAVEAWRDHAVPGWRELPVIPAQIRVRNEKGLTGLARTWIEVNYAPQMRVPGAPIITEREPTGTRHVPGRSPWGGYDLSSTAVSGAGSSEETVDIDCEPIEAGSPARTDTAIGL
ncbi:DUF6349 family protein [Microbacterium lacticum]